MDRLDPEAECVTALALGGGGHADHRAVVHHLARADDHASVGVGAREYADFLRRERGSYERGGYERGGYERCRYERCRCERARCERSEEGRALPP